MVGAFERMHTVTDFCDGPIAGVADFNGVPHLYAAEWDAARRGSTSVFQLTPISQETFRLLMEDWEIWRRWETADFAGNAPQGRHPALPRDRARHDELVRQIAERINNARLPVVRAHGTVKFDPTMPSLGVRLSALVVRWDPC